MSDRIKLLLTSDRFFFMVVVLLVGLVAYGLGREAGLLVNDEQQPAIVFTAAPATFNSAEAVPVVASRGGTKYHRLDCPGANTIKSSNKVYFDSINLARAAGYLPARNCSGLQ